MMDFQTVSIDGVRLENVDYAETLEWISGRIARRAGCSLIATVNLDFLTLARRDQGFRGILERSALNVADGMPLLWLSRMKGVVLKARVTGSDLTPMVAERAAKEGWSLFLLGGAEGVAEQAAGILSGRYPGLKISGTYSPPYAPIDDMDHDGIVRKINESEADILLVAFGAPKQEKWVDLNCDRLNVAVAMGIGGTLDFIAGTQTRAPVLFQRSGLEWVWRTMTDPKRFIPRYWKNGVLFLSLFLKMMFIVSSERCSDGSN